MAFQSAQQFFTRCSTVAALLLIVFVTTGCASTGGPEVLTIDAADYERAFDVAMDATSDQGFQLVLRDRRSGVIETDPVIAESILEPWRHNGASFDETMDNTVHLQRRRARIEFRPAAFADDEAGDPMQGPDLLGIDRPMTDLTATSEGPIEIRAWVWVERSYDSGRRRFAWTRNSTSSMKIIDPDTGMTTSSNRWAPMSRDEAFERRLLARIQAQLESTP